MINWGAIAPLFCSLYPPYFTMDKAYISDWLADQIEDSCFDFPEDFDAKLAVEQLNCWFDDQIIHDHLDALLFKLLEKI